MQGLHSVCVDEFPLRPYVVDFPVEALSKVLLTAWHPVDDAGHLANTANDCAVGHSSTHTMAGYSAKASRILMSVLSLSG